MLKILFICTHNRCRSILSEVITNALANDRIIARSAGSQPAGEVHPLSIKYLHKSGYETNNLTSNSWDEYEDWQPDVVITVCDSAANESCPVWFGDTIKVHWGLADPSRIEGSEEDIERAFLNTIDAITSRIEQLLKHPFESYLSEQLESTLIQLGPNHGSV